jgi:putative FmdB family regulatory protein
MPIYEYQCSKCGVFEITQRITEPPLRRCPTCKARVTKLISSTSFHLKGTGWYVTDYASKGGGGGKAESDPTSDAAKGETNTAKGETKTESSAEPSKETKNSPKKPEATAA